jgi:hypothetical protein
VILSELKETMERDKLSREEAIMRVLSQFVTENNLSMTAVISYPEADGWTMPVIAVLSRELPFDVLMAHGEVHSETIRRAIQQRKNQNENL